MNGHLKVSDGRTVVVHDGLTIGRVAGCDLVIDDTKASRRHARFVVQAGVVEVEDLGSSNGTLLNGKPVQRRVVRDGDEIQIGATRIVYFEMAASSKAAADDVDLFGNEEPPKSGPSARGADGDLDVSAGAALPKRAPSQPPVVVPPPRSTVEFADEVVEVRKAAAPIRGSAPLGPAAEPQLAQKQRILQYSQHKTAGPLGDDLSQLSGGKRGFVVVLVLFGAAALAWALMNLVS